MIEINRQAVKNPVAFLRPLNLQIFKIAAEYIEQRRPQSFLDVGAGICLFSSILQLPGNSRKFACDIRLDNLLEGQFVLSQHRQTSRLVRSWAQILPFKDNSFQSAAILTVFINISDLNVVEKILREMRRVIVPGGFAVFEFRNTRNFPLRLKHLLNRLVEKDLPVTAFSRRQFRKMLQKTGWREEKVIPIWPWAACFTPSYIVIARKP